mmetsp:Transcript_23841/g.60337  ORF Transcript_23841/g.60337 Transcript_23841/m.60337 type:complete len:411 (-) Transcript_23841:129-1361(-)
MIATLLEARALAGDSLPAKQHNSFPAFVFHWMLRTYGRRSHALANLADLLHSAQLHHELHARVRVFAQLAGLLGEAATPEALTFVRKAYTSAYPPHKLHDSLTADALVDIHFNASADAEQAKEKLSIEALIAENPLDHWLGRGTYSMATASTIVRFMELPVSLETQVGEWVEKRLRSDPAVEPLEAVLARFEATGLPTAAAATAAAVAATSAPAPVAAGALPRSPAKRAPPVVAITTKVPALPMDELVETLLRAYLALRHEELRGLRELYADHDINGDGVLSVGEFGALCAMAARASGQRRSISADESQAFFLEALRETQMHEPASVEDSISLAAWVTVASRHALAHGYNDAMGVPLVPPLGTQASAQSFEPAFSADETFRETSRRRRTERRSLRGSVGSVAGTPNQLLL